MAATLKKVTNLLKSDEEDLQASAIKVVGELRPKDKGTVKALGEILKASRSVRVRQNVVEALGKIGNPTTINQLIGFLNDPQMVATTVESIVRIGPSAIKPLTRRYAREGIAFKKSVIEILVRLRDRESIKFLFKIINEGENSLLEYISEIIRRYSGEFSPASKRLFRQQLLLNIKKGMKSNNELVMVIYIKLIGIVQAQEAFPNLIKFMDPIMPARVRRNAILSLMALPLGKKHEGRLIKLLLPLMEDRDYPNIVWNVIKILERYKLPGGQTEKYVIKLLKTSPHRGVKKFAINYLSGLKTQTSINAVIDAMWEQDKELRDEALYGIKNIKKSIDIIVDRMAGEKDDDRMETYIEILRNSISVLKRGHIDKLKKYLKRGVENEQKYIRALFPLLKQLEAEKIRDYLIGEFGKVRVAEKLDVAENYIRLLAESEFDSPEIRLELALILLKKADRKEFEREKLEESEMITIFNSLISNKKFAIVKNMKARSKFLGREDYLFIGRYYAANLGREKAFGGEMLRYVIKTWGKTKEARKAKEIMSLEKIPLDV